MINISVQNLSGYSNLEDFIAHYKSVTGRTPRASQIVAQVYGAARINILLSDVFNGFSESYEEDNIDLYDFYIRYGMPWLGVRWETSTLIFEPNLFENGLQTVNESGFSREQFLIDFSQRYPTAGVFDLNSVEILRNYSCEDFFNGVPVPAGTPINEVFPKNVETAYVSFTFDLDNETSSLILNSIVFKDSQEYEIFPKTVEFLFKVDGFNDIIAENFVTLPEGEVSGTVPQRENSYAVFNHADGEIYYWSFDLIKFSKDGVLVPEDYELALQGYYSEIYYTVENFDNSPGFLIPMNYFSIQINESVPFLPGDYQINSKNAYNGSLFWTNERDEDYLATVEISPNDAYFNYDYKNRGTFLIEENATFRLYIDNYDYHGWDISVTGDIDVYDYGSNLEIYANGDGSITLTDPSDIPVYDDALNWQGMVLAMGLGRG